MGDSDSRGSLVDMLAARSACAVVIYPQIIRINVDFNIFIHLGRDIKTCK